MGCLVIQDGQAQVGMAPVAPMGRGSVRSPVQAVDDGQATDMPVPWVHNNQTNNSLLGFVTDDGNIWNGRNLSCNNIPARTRTRFMWCSASERDASEITTHKTAKTAARVGGTGWSPVACQRGHGHVRGLPIIHCLHRAAHGPSSHWGNRSHANLRLPVLDYETTHLR
eukprot:gene15373-biopygen11389